MWSSLLKFGRVHEKSIEVRAKEKKVVTTTIA